jgi:hypothetical protein
MRTRARRLSMTVVIPSAVVMAAVLIHRAGMRDTDLLRERRHRHDQEEDKEQSHRHASFVDVRSVVFGFTEPPGRRALMDRGVAHRALGIF